LTLGRLGVIDVRLGRYQKAAGYLRQALDLFQEMGNKSGEAEILALLGEAYVGLGRYEHAGGNFERSLTMSREIDTRVTEAVALNGLGDVLLHTGDAGKARAQYATALRLASEADAPQEQARAHSGLARACQAEGDQVQARHHLQEALTRYDAIGAPKPTRSAPRWPQVRISRRCPGLTSLWDIRLVPDKEARLPLRVVAGDKVRLVSPASYPEPEWIEESVRILEGWGLIAEVAEHALARWGYMAGRDPGRLADLNEAFRDPAVRAVITTRGGAGAYRIADDIDFDAVREDPKPVVGFSDITYLHLALWQYCRVPGIHGCLAGATAISTVRQLLMTSHPLVLERDAAAVSAAIQVGGQARGRLIGGNLTAVATSVGVRLPDLTGAILFLEAQREIGLGLIDRQLTQLVRSKALDGVTGIALGSFQGFGGLDDRGWTILTCCMTGSAA
jgi:muramoyltetrapeptide carboxypeptidase